MSKRIVRSSPMHKILSKIIDETTMRWCPKWSDQDKNNQPHQDDVSSRGWQIWDTAGVVSRAREAQLFLCF